MKEFLNFSAFDKNEATELSIKKQKEVEYVLIGTLNLQKGHKVFEINIDTNNVTEAKYKRDTAFIGSGITPSEKLIINKDCIYIPALNKQNALKKYFKNNYQSHYYKTPPLMTL